MRHLALVLILVCGLVPCATALTINRSGGANQPAPELDVPYEFVQLDWADADPNLHGAFDQLAVDNGSVAPQRLDPDVNLTPLIDSELGGEIRILQWAGWKKRESEDIAAVERHLEEFLGMSLKIKPEEAWLLDLGATD